MKKGGCGKPAAENTMSELNEPELEELFENRKEFRKFMTMYHSAIKEVRTKFEILNDDLSMDYDRNPIEMIKSRMKSPESIAEKLRRKGLAFSVENIVESINDIAGIRVICSFVDDIYKVAEMLVSQDDINVLEVRDYIKNPKPNGYRSYHMIVEVPVFFAQFRQNMKVEVQLRTIAMDFWASLEHKMRYKKDIEGGDDIVRRLKDCAAQIALTDNEMQEINKSINKIRREQND